VAEVDARLAKMKRQKLRVHIGDVQERDVAEARQVVELGGRLCLAQARPERGAGRRSAGEQAEELAPAQTTRSPARPDREAGRSGPLRGGGADERGGQKQGR